MLMKQPYLMEHAGECSRLDMKTRPEQVISQAQGAGIGPGMKVLDAGCGSGKTSAILKDVVGPSGSVTGLDISYDRIEEARSRYDRKGLFYVQHDLYTPYIENGPGFDAAWIRFMLEYFRSDPLLIVRNSIASLKSGGTLVLIDLDMNCLNHHGMPPKLERTMHSVVEHLEEYHNWDPYAGRKLYTHLYDLGFKDIDVHVEAHHNIFGPLGIMDETNWLAKVLVACKNSGCRFEEFGGDFEAGLAAFKEYFKDPRRYTYTPLIVARGTKP